ncbi:MAG TPA: LLM class flavin-dependent oxidoreductase [Mycobacteriales bacterium]|nr:LLM class flavin-dependent oxidoreductase [Mycobacteriales bacterium]
MTDLSRVPLSVLDLSPVPTGSTTAAALADSLALVRHVEDLGYLRYWVAEHHGMPGIASSSPAVLIGALAAASSRIRVGSGGVMLPNHAPLVVAEQFGMLEALHPGRIDLGLGRAPGTDPRTAAALRRSVDGLSAEEFPQQLAQLRGFFRGPVAGVTAVPAVGNEPPVWLLGSSGYSAQVAGILGLPFAFAHHFSGQHTLPALGLYRDSFRPSESLEQPYAMVCVSVLVADDDETARRLALPGGLSFLRLRSGRPGPVPTVLEAETYPYSAHERAFVEDRLDSQVIGGPETARRSLEDLLAATSADELMVTTLTHDPADRLRSYRLLAEVAARVAA